MNDEFFHAQAANVAQRLLSQPDETARVNELFRIVLQRLPTASETGNSSADSLVNISWRSQTPETDQSLARCRLLLSSNEFLFRISGVVFSNAGGMLFESA